MKDILYLYLDFDVNDRVQLRTVTELLPQADALLEKHGWEYTGFQNMYRPVKGTDPDDTWDEAEQAIEEAEWLKEYKPHLAYGIWTNFCELNEIVVPETMDPIDEAKLARYREYYENNGKYAHSIIVDEENTLHDGYMTYLFAREDGRHSPQIMRVRKGQVFKKIVAGQCEDEQSVWYYEDGPAVCPGDVISVPGGKQLAVDYIGYVAGKNDCEKYQSIKAEG